MKRCAMICASLLCAAFVVSSCGDAPIHLDNPSASARVVVTLKDRGDQVIVAAVIPAMVRTGADAMVPVLVAVDYPGGQKCVSVGMSRLPELPPTTQMGTEAPLVERYGPPISTCVQLGSRMESVSGLTPGTYFITIDGEPTDSRILVSSG